MTGRWLHGAFVIITLAVCVQHSASSTLFQASEPVPGEIGSHLPDFSVKDLQGKHISSADLKGKVVIIDFWATWCGPCKQEMPGYQKLLDRYGSEGLAVIGLKSNVMAE